MGNALIKLIDQNMITHTGPDFDTLVTTISKGRSDIILGNKNIHINYSVQQGW